MATHDSTTTRRSILAAAAAAVPAAALAAQPAQTADTALEELLARFRAAQTAFNAAEGDVLEDGDTLARYEQMRALREDIFRAPAGTKRGAQIKWELFEETVDAPRNYPLAQEAFRSIRQAIDALPA